ncbi:MAG: hypothetical protein AAGB13_12005 [Cyanobacteria bacterium P01_F01_bin.33]
MESSERSPDIRKIVKLTNPEKLYAIEDSEGRSIPFEQADGRQLFNHYRHNVTNYDNVLNFVRDENGRVTGWQQKQATQAAAEQVLEEFRDEHFKVIQDAQKKGNILRNLMHRAGVGTAEALSNILDSMSEKIKDIAKLKSSQSQLRVWNDIYRVQYRLTQELIERENVAPEVIDKINAIYSTRSVEKAVEKGADFFNLEKSEILNMLKKVKAIRYPTANIKKVL